MSARPIIGNSSSLLWSGATVRAARQVVVLLLLGATTSSVFAQNFQKINPKYTRKTVSSLQRVVSQALRDPAVYQAEEKKFDEYFRTYFFPKMTLYQPNDLGSLGKNREVLFKSLRGTTVEAARQQLTKISLQAGRSFSRGNYHPAVRYNGALIIGLLDQDYATAEQPPVPLPQGAVALLELLEQDSFTIKQKQVKVLASVKAAALVGLERHARLGIADEESARRVTKAALAAGAASLKARLSGSSPASKMTGAVPSRL